MLIHSKAKINQIMIAPGHAEEFMRIYKTLPNRKPNAEKNRTKIQEKRFVLVGKPYDKN